MKKLFIILVVCFILNGVVYAGLPQDKYVIKNATVVTVTGPTIERGAVVIEGDKITYVGTSPSVPYNAEVIDAEGLYVYPGMFNPYTNLGLSEIGSVPMTNDSREVGNYNTFVRAASALNPHSVHIPITRVNGVTTAISAPQSGLIGGYAAMINLYGWTIEEMLLKEQAALTLGFPRGEARSYNREPTEKEKKQAAERAQKQIKELEEFFKKARTYRKALEGYKNGELKRSPVVDMQLEALFPVIEGKVPVLVMVNSEKDIKKAVEFVNKIKVKAIFVGVKDGWKVADLLAENNIPCLLGSVTSAPGNKDPFDAGYANAGVLHKAGVKISFISPGATDARNLPYYAGISASYGLPKAEALKAVTINPAKMFGIEDKIGSIEVGKLANIVVTDDDLLEMRTHIKHLFISGKKVELTSKHIELYETYKKKYGIK